MSATTATNSSAAAVEATFKVLGKKDFRGETTLTIAADDLQGVCRFCRDELGFDYLIDITSIDNFGDEPRFQVVYELSKLETVEHLRLKITVSEDALEVPTITELWATADWHEREIYDMMGIRFIGHPDLRRILMWEGYPYYPLRKDFPLEGKPSNVPEVAFTAPAPLEGGPFITVPTTGTVKDREPRARAINPVPEQESAPSTDRIK